MKKILFGINHDGSIHIPEGYIPESISKLIEIIQQSITDLDLFVNNNITDLKKNIHVVNNHEFAFALIDSDEKVLYGIRHDGSRTQQHEKLKIMFSL